jgi:hypothetical protein
MGKLTIFVTGVISAFIITSCSASKNSINYSFRYTANSKLDPYTEVYNYNYKMEKGQWKEINIYVCMYPSPESRNYMINIGSNISFSWLMQAKTVLNTYNYSYPVLNKPTIFYYHDDVPWSNFYYPLDNVKAKVNNLREAIELALNIYLQRE